MKKIIVGVFIILGILIMRQVREIEFKKNFFSCDTLFNIKLTTRKDPSKVFDEIESLLSKYNKLFDKRNKYDGVNNIYVINEEDYEKLKLEPDLIEVLEKSLDLVNDSNGYFNVYAGNIIDNFKEDKNLSSEIIYPKFSGGYLLYDEYNIDLGGIAKGYISSEIEKVLKSNDISNYIINAGGQVTVGEKNDLYSIKIKDPHEINNFNVYIKNVTVGTSGNYERGDHIIDVVNEEIVNKYSSVSVIHDDPVIVDYLTTLLYIIDIEDGKKYLDKYEASAMYNNKDNIIRSEGYSNYEEK